MSIRKKGTKGTDPTDMDDMPKSDELEVGGSKHWANVHKQKTGAAPATVGMFFKY